MAGFDALWKLLVLAFELPTFYRPTGPLSSVTTVAILVWLLTWLILEWRWGKRGVIMSRINTLSITLLVLGILLTFPPIVDLL